MDKLIGGLIGIIIVGAILLGVWYCIWLLWCYVLGTAWPSGPALLIAPGYWFFVAAWVLVAMVGRAAFGGSKS